MRLVLVLLAWVSVVSPGASAQEIPQWRSGAEEMQRVGENALLVVGGLAGAAIPLNLGAVALRGLDPSPNVTVPLGYAVGVTGFALGVHGAARILRIDGSLQNALADAWTGAAVGSALGGALILINPDDIGLVLTGTALAVVVPVSWVLSDYRRATPTTLLRPDGAPAPGLSLRIGL